jgi:predicted XRE-type DNA-binding protein
MKNSDLTKLLSSCPSELKVINRKVELMLNILAKKEELGCTQKEFAALAGTTQPKISSISKGEISQMTIGWLMVVADKVGAESFLETKPA